MRILVTYFSQSGNTRKVAEAIHEELGSDAELKELSEVENLDGYDLTFLGFPIMAFGPAQPAKEFMEKHADGKKVALFVTHAAPEDEAQLEDWLVNCRKAATCAESVGFFHCQGELAEAVAEALLKSDNEMLQAFGRRRPDTLGQPDAERLARARAFARETMEKA